MSLSTKFIEEGAKTALSVALCSVLKTSLIGDTSDTARAAKGMSKIAAHAVDRFFDKSRKSGRRPLLEKFMELFERVANDLSDLIPELSNPSLYQQGTSDVLELEEYLAIFSQVFEHCELPAALRKTVGDKLPRELIPVAYTAFLATTDELAARRSKRRNDLLGIIDRSKATELLVDALSILVRAVYTETIRRKMAYSVPGRVLLRDQQKLNLRR